MGGGGGAAGLAAVLSQGEGRSVAAAPHVGGGVSHGERRRSGVGRRSQFGSGTSPKERLQHGGGASLRRRRLSW